MKTPCASRCRRKIWLNTRKAEDKRQPHPKHDHLLNGCLPLSLPPLQLITVLSKTPLYFSDTGSKQQLNLESIPLCTTAQVPRHLISSKKISNLISQVTDGNIRSKVIHSDKTSKERFRSTKVETEILFQKL